MVLFPDQPEYKRQITDVVRIPIDVDIAISTLDQRGKKIPYHLSEQH